MTIPLPRLALLLALLAGCDGGEKETGLGDESDADADADTDADTDADADADTDADPDPDTVPLGGECAMEQDYGGFAVEHYEDYTVVSGSITDGVVPITVLEELGAEGECKMLRRNNPFCDPACENGFTCDFDGTCVPYPESQDLGTVTIDGLAVDVAMEPVTPGYTYFNTSLPHPGFEPGALITLGMDAGLYGPATLYGVGVDPMIPTEDEWVIAEGEDLVVHWDAPTVAAVRSTVQLNVNIDQHGISPAIIRCEFADDGEGTVPASLIDQLVNAGVTGYPNGSLNRHTADNATAGDGCMDFQVTSYRAMAVDVAGFTPCITDLDCPKDQDCNIELQICEDEE